MLEHTPETAQPVVDERQRLDPRSITAGRVGGWIFVLVLALLMVPGLLAGFLLKPGLGLAIGLVLVLLVLALLAVLAHVGPVWRYTHTWYRVDAFGIEIGRGRFWQRLITVPHARVQHLDVVRGPVDRRFGLATLVIYTAGQATSEVKIEGLSHEAALALRERLVRERGLDAV